MFYGSLTLVISNFEQISVNISLTLSKNLYVIAAYVPSNYADEVYSDHIDCLSTKFNGIRDTDEILLLGDYNL